MRNRCRRIRNTKAAGEQKTQPDEQRIIRNKCSRRSKCSRRRPEEQQ